MLLHDSIVQKIYLIDNSAFDELREVASLSSKVKYLFLNRNVGFGAGHNIAMKEAIREESQFHIVLNPDIVFSAGVVENIANYMEDKLDIGLIMPKVVYPDGSIQYLAKMLPAPFDWIGRRFFPIKTVTERRNRIFEMRSSGYDKIMNIPYLSGCFMFLRISALKDVGLFDEHIFMYGEDTDLTRRIHQKYRTLFYPNVTVTHVHNKESYRNYKLLWIHIKAAIYYFNKWGWLIDKERTNVNRELKRKYLTELT